MKCVELMGDADSRQVHQQVLLIFGQIGEASHKPLDGTLTVNACDALTFLTGGYVKSTVHRYVPRGMSIDAS